MRLLPRQDGTVSSHIVLVLPWSYRPFFFFLLGEEEGGGVGGGSRIMNETRIALTL